MKLTYAIAIVGIVVLSFFVSTDSTLAGESENRFKQDVEFREKMGLNADLEHIQQVVTEKNNKASKKQHGVYLTVEEMQDLNERIAHQSEFMPIILEYVNENITEEDFGGLYIDQSEKGTLYISFTKDLKHFKKEIKDLAKLYKKEQKVKFRFVESSYEELQQQNDAVWKLYDLLKKQGVNIKAVKTDVKSNAVEISVYPLNSEIKAVLKQNLKFKYKVKEEKRNGADESRYDYQRPLEGGLAIENLDYNQDGVGYCTSGFSAVHQGDLYLVTAGHCGDSGDRYNQGGTYFGYMEKVADNANTDIGLIKLSIDSHAGIGNYEKDNFTDWQREYEKYVGQYVCKNGITTGNTCGTVEDIDYSWFGHYDFVAADYGSDNGDSGAPVYKGGLIVGIHKGTYFGYKVYTPVDQAVDYYNLSPLF